MLKSAAVARFLSLAWCATLIGLMASGSFSSARIGTMTWGPEHDIWSATIAISQINFGLSGKLGFKEVEQAIANEVISTKNVWRIMDEKTQSLLRDPEAVMRGLRQLPLFIYRIFLSLRQIRGTSPTGARISGMRISIILRSVYSGLVLSVRIGFMLVLFPARLFSSLSPSFGKIWPSHLSLWVSRRFFLHPPPFFLN